MVRAGASTETTESRPFFLLEGPNRQAYKYISNDHEVIAIVATGTDKEALEEFNLNLGPQDETIEKAVPRKDNRRTTE